MAPELVYALNRGCWELGTDRAAEQTIALYASTGDQTVRLAVEIDRIDPVGEAGGRKLYAVVGRILTDEHPVHRAYVGRRAPERLQQTFRYCEPECGVVLSDAGGACTAVAQWIVSEEASEEVSGAAPDEGFRQYMACGEHMAPPGTGRYRVRPIV
ncbi:hypothetical protein [Streptomyces sp. NPDC089799]|uniref:hypothetical protein n=1 Tax=Streptomyces sp. NPDC089799 TaxID=3155066 RepID=UPI003430A261